MSRKPVRLSVKKNWRLLMFAVLCVLTGTFVFPLFILFIASFKSHLEIFSAPFALPNEWLWQNYQEAFSTMRFPTSLKNSLIMSFSAIAGLVVFGSMAGYACARSGLRLMHGIYYLFVSCIIVPFQTAMIPLVRMLASLKANGTYFSVIIIYIGINMAFTVFLYTGFMGSLPKELDEAATVDGCGRWGIFLRIISPLSAPTTATVIILNFLAIWNDFFIPMLMITDKNKRNIPLALLQFQGEYSTKWNLIFAGVTLSAIPIIIIYLALQKYIIKGVAQGAVKG